MRRNRIKMLLLAGVLALILLTSPAVLDSCDHNSGTQGTTSGARPAEDDPTDENPVVLRAMTPLAPARKTHVAIGALGNIYWVQESPDGNDVMFIMGEAEVPRATEVSSARLLEKMNLAGGVGNIQSIVASNIDGYIYFYFFGGKERQAAACIGRCSPRGGRFEIVADTRTIQEASGMGISLSLANAKLIATRDRVWLSLWHTDRTVLLYFEPEEGKEKLTLRKPFDYVKADATPVKLNGNRWELFASSFAAQLLMLDRSNGDVWKIDQDTGVASPMYEGQGLPDITAEPACDRQGRVILFAADTGPVQLSDEARYSHDYAGMDFPAFLVIGKDKVKAMTYHHWRVPLDYPVHSMRLTEMRPGKQDGTWITYDSFNGNLVRVRFKTD